MNKKDWRDYLTYFFAAAIVIYASVYLWNNRSDTAFGIWAGVVGTLAAVLRWLDLRDDKERDAQ